MQCHPKLLDEQEERMQVFVTGWLSPAAAADQEQAVDVGVLKSEDGTGSVLIEYCEHVGV